MPVREAVMKLVAEEALEVLPNRAVRVPQMSAEQFRQLTAVRIAVEGFAAAEAAAARSADELAAIVRFDEAFRAEFDRASPHLIAAAHANRSLHFALYRAAHLPPRMAIIEGLWLKVGPVLTLADRRDPRVRIAEDHHRAIVEAVQ